MNRKKIIRVFIFLGLLLFVAFLVIKPIDKSALHTRPYVSKMMHAVDSAMSQLDTSKKLVEAGWSKRNITPQQPVRIVGFGYQPNFEKVYDSTFVRTAVFSDGNNTYALISFDLLFVHPNLVDHIEDALKKTGIQLDGIYYAATHSHNSFGGWGYNRLFDQVMLDGEHSFILQHIAQQTTSALAESIKNLSTTLIGGSSFNFHSFLRNRISGDGKLDPWMHVIQLIHPQEQDTALISTFSAHATCLFSQMDLNTVSSDYPGVLARSFEKPDNRNTFIFCAGGVASFNPTHNRSNFESMEKYGQSLYHQLYDSISTIQSTSCFNLHFFETDLLLPEPCLKVTNHFQIRPWIFNNTIGFVQPKLNYLQLGTSTLIGLPGEVSGELYLEEIEKANKRGDELIVTSFNGNYIGYTVPDHYYFTKKTHEVGVMNWFGPVNGSYFKKIVERVGKKN